MTIDRFLKSLLAAALACLGPFAHAQAFPTRPIKIVTPFPPGQGPDVLLRMVADKISVSQSGKVRFLAVAGPKRIATEAEAGGPAGWTVAGWNGLLAPKGTPKEVIQRLNEEIVKAMQSPDIRDKMQLFTYESYTMSPTEMATLMEQEVAAWAPTIQKSGLKLD